MKKEWHLHDGTLPNTETNYLILNNFNVSLYLLIQQYNLY